MNERYLRITKCTECYHCDLKWVRCRLSGHRLNYSEKYGWGHDILANCKLPQDVLDTSNPPVSGSDIDINKI